MEFMRILFKDLVSTSQKIFYASNVWTNGLTLFTKKIYFFNMRSTRTPKNTVWLNADIVMLRIDVSTQLMFFKGLKGY